MGDEAPAPAGGRGPWRRRGSDLLDVRGLEALRTVDDLELHRVALTERAEAIRLDGGVVDEDILATVLRETFSPSWAVERVGGPGRRGGFLRARGLPALRSRQWRSEERRVGKECRSRWSPYH